MLEIVGTGVEATLIAEETDEEAAGAAAAPPAPDTLVVKSPLST